LSWLPPPPAIPPSDVAYEQHGGQRFVTADVIKGLVPEVVEHLGNCRARAKVAYAAATDPTIKRINKARELAFKICSNSMYGALGSSQSMLPLMEIAATVTAIGRNDILTSKGIAERLYPDAKVVYGKLIPSPSV
jgi:DNA polymerase delta subunit 1